MPPSTPPSLNPAKSFPSSAFGSTFGDSKVALIWRIGSGLMTP